MSSKTKTALILLSIAVAFFIGVVIEALAMVSAATPRSNTRAC